MSLKRGKYSRAEEQFVIDEVNSLTIQEIADKLGRATNSVESLVRRKKLKVIVTKEDREDITRLIGILHKSPHWEKIIIALTKKEIKWFQKDWISMVGQFGEDVWYTEEKYIVDWLLLDIKKYRTLKLEKDALQEVERLEKELTEEYAIDMEVRDGMLIVSLEQQLALQKSAMTQHNAALKVIMDKMETMGKHLKANREERRDIKANEDTYWGYIQMLEDEKYRKRESRQAQLMKMAQNKAREKLYEYHEYMDGEIDIPLLTPEIALRKREEDKYERAETPSDNV